MLYGFLLNNSLYQNRCGILKGLIMKRYHGFLFFLFCLLLTGLVSAQTVSWKQGTVGPAAWSITPASPGNTDLISFSGPTNVYGNSCAGKAALGGTPVVSINHVNKVVELSFQGPAPAVCPLVWMPVCGLQGNFGPLAPGNWVFKCTVPAIAFNISFTVSGIPLNTIVYVDKDAPGPIHNGSSWNWAFTTVQDALNAAGSGTEIRVAQGVYMPDRGIGIALGDRNASFTIKPGVVLKGGYIGWNAINPNLRNPESYPTVLSGDLQGNDLWGLLNLDDNSYHVVSIIDPNLPGCEIDGFVISNGMADGPETRHYGGGIYIDLAFALFKNCVIVNNTAGFGGAAACQNGSPEFINCKISGNSSRVFGGGIYADTSSITLTNCLVTGNSAYQAEFTGGSAIYSFSSDIELLNSTVADNAAPTGHAIVSFVWSFPASNTLKVSNSILYNGGNELLTNHPGTVTVKYSDVKGAWSGPGNIHKDPKFVSPGQWSIEGQWIAGDYSLKSVSSCINKGRNSLIPVDTGDIDEDGNITEKLPVDLAGNTRIKQAKVDMGCYEKAGIVVPPPVPGPIWQAVMTTDIEWDVPVGAPHFTSVSGSAVLNIELNFKARLKTQIQASSPAGGTWTAVFDPDPGAVGPGNVSVKVKIHGTHIDTTKLTPGPDRKVAELTILVKPD